MIVRSRYEFARRGGRAGGSEFQALVIGKPLSEMGGRAKRLNYSVLEMRALKQNGFTVPRPWEEALRDYVRLAWQEKK